MLSNDATIGVIEVVSAPSQPNRLPNPENDGIVAIFYAWQDVDYPTGDGALICNSGVLALGGSPLSNRRLRNAPIEVVSTELELLNKLIDIVNDVDPDILTGWNVQISSWGYLAARCNTYGS
jgi:DNA polymerase zeta